MLIDTRQRITHHNLTVHISGQALTEVPHIKYLGVFIDQHLKHTECVLQRIRRKLHCLYCLQPLSHTILFQLYQGFILPIIDYYDTVWAPPTALLSKSMERIHARFVSHMSNDVGFVKVTLTECRRFHTIVQVYKILHQLVPVYLQDMFTFSEKVTDYVSRNSHRLFIPRMRTTYGQKSLFYRGMVA